jgi:hypothetical protein
VILKTPCKVVDVTNGITSKVFLLPPPKRKGAGFFSKGKPRDKTKVNGINIQVTDKSGTVLATGG